MTANIPLELLEQFERGNVLLFVGERIARAADGRAWIDQLTANLTVRCPDPVKPSQATFPEAAQAYEDAHGRQALVQFLRDQFDAPTAGDPSAPRLIAGLTDCDVLATTCIDRPLETAFADAQRPLNVVTGNVDVAFADARQATLYKLRGALEQPESLVLTEDDYEAFFDDQASISLVLQAHLATKTVLFVGYDLEDPHFKRLYRKVTAPLDHYARRAYAFGDAPPPQVCRWCERHGINVISADAKTFLEALTAQLAARQRPAPAPAPAPTVDTGPVALPMRPYKLLDYYEAQDAAIFFGRQTETRQLTSLIHAHRLVLLYGASGTGKTSLLLAGAVPRLEAADPAYATVYVRALEDPADVIRRAVGRFTNSELPIPNHVSLVDFLHAATQALGCPLVIILDQFEEFFIRLSPEFRQTFIAELGALYDARDVPVKVVLSLREDWLASINELEQRIPEVFRTRMRLLPLTRDQAREAITAPVDRMCVTYEPALVERLLDDLTGGTAIMPPQLQLVCSALYDSLPAKQTQITLATYEALGGARGVLQAYLDAELTRLPAGEQALARDLLEELVTSEHTKAVKTGAELALVLDVDTVTLAPVLEKLLRARLLRVLEREKEKAYELVHEYLIAEIGLELESVARKEAEELVRQEMENWQRFGTLLAADKLNLISDIQDKLRLNPKSCEFLLRSTLKTRQEAEHWLARVSPEQRTNILIELAHSDQIEVRQQIAELLGSWHDSKGVEALLRLAIYDPAAAVRMVSRNSVAKLAEKYPMVLDWLRIEMERTEGTVRQSVLDTLAFLPLGRLPLILRIQILTRMLMVRMSSHMPRLVRWTVVSAVGGGIGWMLSNIFFGVVFAHSFASVFMNVKKPPAGIGWGALSGVFSGIAIGGAQWFLLRRRVHCGGWWVFASACGWIIGGAVGASMGWIVNTTAVEVVFWIVFGAVSGLVIGEVQWLYIKRVMCHHTYWILASIFGWAFGWALVVIWLNPISEVTLVLIEFLAGPARSFAGFALSDSVRWVVGGSILGTVGGAITGIPLLGLLGRAFLNESREGQ